MGLLIEKLSGLKYRDYVRQNILTKPGMTSSDFVRLDQAHENVAEGNDPLRDETGQIAGWKKNIYPFPLIGSPDSGAYVTASDLDRFLRSVKEGELLSSNLTEVFFTPQVHYRAMDEGTKKYGYGLWFLTDQADQVVFCEKEGINPGVSGLIRYRPEGDISKVILSNMEDGVWEPVRKVHELVIAGQLA